MPIEGINTTLFDKFTAFASEKLAANNGKSIARLVEGGPLHTLTAADPTLDKVGKWRRNSREGGLNDQARTLFLQAVGDLFGGQEYIPESVTKVMKLDKFGHGKPLTARRIEYVRQAVERHFQAFPAAFAEAKTKAPNAYNHFNQADVEASMAQALSTVSADPDATRLVVKLIDNLLVTTNVQLRTPAAIRAKAKALLENVQELRAAARGNQRVFEAGLTFLGQLSGKALPAGALRFVIRNVKAPNSVRPGCGATKLHKAFACYAKAIQNLLTASGSDSVLTDAVGRVYFNLFVGALMMAKCDRQKIQDLHDALRPLHYDRFRRLPFPQNGGRRQQKKCKKKQRHGSLETTHSAPPLHVFLHPTIPFTFFQVFRRLFKNSFNKIRLFIL